MSNIAIITARGGSKRIPKKNIKDFCGKPILAYSIQVAKNSKLFDHVMVSTDDDRIAAIARDYGAEVPFMRSRSTSDDFSTTEDVLKEVIRKYEDIGYRFELACCIYPTAPFISVKRLEEAYHMLLCDGCNVVFPVVQFSFPPQRGLFIRDGFIYPASPADYEKRSQDLEPIYHDSGQFYFFRVNSFLKTGSVVSQSRPLIISEMEVQDIDTMTDWMLAEVKYRLLQNSD